MSCQSEDDEHIKQDSYDIPKIKLLIPQLFSVCEQLERAASGLRFKPAGQLIGTIGELLVCDKLGLRMAPSSTERFDAFTSDGEPVQVKTTVRGQYVPLWHGEGRLVVALLGRDGSLEVVYNGSRACARADAGKKWRKGFCPLTLSRLRQLLATSSIPQSC